MRKKGLLFLRFFLGILVVLAFNMPAEAKIVMNYSESSFDEQIRGNVGTYVVEAAGYFLKFQADMFLFLSKIELSEIEGTDFNELRTVIDRAVFNMRNANSKYSELAATADAAAYNQTVIDQLVSFDYAKFRKNNGLNRTVCDEVQAYLGSGDVRGVYYKLYLDTQQILDLLTPLKSAVDADTLPDMPAVWQVNRSFSNTFLFGQYAAEIFYEITGK